MNMRSISILFVLALALPGSLGAIQITGKVAAVSGDTATIAMDGDVLPSVGDKADVFFKLGNAEVSVGSGKVTEATAGSIKAKIDNKTGTVAKDQLVRIETGRQSQATEKTTPTKAAGPNPLLGDWTAAAPGGATVSFSFKEDNTLLWVIEEPTSAKSTVGKYQVDASVTPHVVEISDLDQADLKGQTLYGLFEMQSDGRLKLDMGDSRERGFSDRETILMSRATSPVVPPTPSPPPTPDTRPPDEQKISLGDEHYEAKDYVGAIKAYTEAINLNPKNASAYKKRGGAFHQKDDYDSAIADWNKAITLDPSFKEDLEWLISKLKSIKELKKVSEKGTGRKP